jgi:hypothetical protein
VPNAQGLVDKVVEDKEVVDAEEAVEPAVERAGAGLRRKLVTVPVAPTSLLERNEERLV